MAVPDPWTLSYGSDPTPEEPESPDLWSFRFQTFGPLFLYTNDPVLVPVLSVCRFVDTTVSTLLVLSDLRP